MKRTFLLGKIHGATVTEANIYYMGSITIGRKMLEACGLLPFEKVEVYNINNGSRLATYIIEGSEGGSEICMNGAAARLVQVGDKVIICSYCDIDLSKEEAPKPIVLRIKNEKNEF